MKRTTLTVLLLSAGLMTACSPAPRGPVEPGSTPATGVGTAASSIGQPGPAASQTGPAGEGVSAAAMLAEADLPGRVRLIDSTPGGPSGPGGIPQGWRGDSQWIFYLPYCAAYSGLRVTGYLSRRAIRANVYKGLGDLEIVEVVERYADTATAARVFNEARAVVAACDVGFGATREHVSPLRAGDDSWSFVSQGGDGRLDWIVVRQGELVAILHAAGVAPLGDLSPAIVARLCGDTARC